MWRAKLPRRYVPVKDSLQPSSVQIMLSDSKVGVTLERLAADGVGEETFRKFATAWLKVPGPVSTFVVHYDETSTYRNRVVVWVPFQLRVQSIGIP